MNNERIKFENCPLCESQHSVLYKVAGCSAHPLYDSRLSPVMKWRQCADCSHVFTEGFYSDEALKILFGKTHEHQKAGAENMEAARAISARMIEKVLSFVSTGTWLDVGFGNASLLLTVQEFGFRAVGLDLRADNVEKARALGVEAHCADIAGFSMNEKCAVISLCDVLEHIPYPKKALVAAHDLLENNGVLFISLPNSESILWNLMTQQNVNPYWGEMEHYHNFSRTGLYQLLAKTGFTPQRFGVSERYRLGMEIVARKCG